MFSLNDDIKITVNNVKINSSSLSNIKMMFFRHHIIEVILIIIRSLKIFSYSTSKVDIFK